MLIESFSQLKVGQRAMIASYKKGSEFTRQKLLALGLVPGAVFTLIRRAPFGDPIEISLAGMPSLILRNIEADALSVRIEL